MTRAIFRLPPYFYRLHLGWIFGHRVLYLVHVGRKSGKVRRNCVEVIHYDRQMKEAVVISAYGTRADWFRNISKNPPLELRIGREKFVPAFRVLPAEEARAILREFFDRHPGEAKLILNRFFHLEPSEAQFEGLSELVPLIAFRPRSGGG